MNLLPSFIVTFQGDDTATDVYIENIIVILAASCDLVYYYGHKFKLILFHFYSGKQPQLYTAIVQNVSSLSIL